MRDHGIVLAGRANYLLERILDTHSIEDYDYFISGMCDSLMGGYDEEWEGFVEDSQDCLNLMAILHLRYRPLVMSYLDRTITAGAGDCGFEVSIIPMPSEGVNLLMVKCFKTYSENMGDLIQFM